MISKTLRCVAVTTALAFAPTMASAATYDAFASFDGVGSSTDGSFTFGSYDGSSFQAFDTVGVSTFPGTLSYSSSGTYYPVAVKTTGGSYASNTVTIPSNALVLSPGPGANGGPFSAIKFVAPAAGVYQIAASAVQIDININTVGVGFADQGVLTGFDLVPGSLSILSNYQPLSLATSRFLAQGATVILLVGNDGSYYSDTTAVNFSLSNDAVPEPATWALMLGGFGLVGAAMRRRAVARVAMVS